MQPVQQTRAPQQYMQQIKPLQQIHASQQPMQHLQPVTQMHAPQQLKFPTYSIPSLYSHQPKLESISLFKTPISENSNDIHNGTGSKFFSSYILNSTSSQAGAFLNDLRTLKDSVCTLELDSVSIKKFVRNTKVQQSDQHDLIDSLSLKIEDIVEDSETYNDRMLDLERKNKELVENIDSLRFQLNDQSQQAILVKQNLTERFFQIERRLKTQENYPIILL